MDDGPTWTGELTLDLRNPRGWSVRAAELTVRRDTVVVRHEGRNLAVLDRDFFRRWLGEPEPVPYAVDDLVWSVQIGMTFMTSGSTTFRVEPDSLRELVAVI
jgi:hypothetical protein